jgi:hypothetical protein
MTERSLKDLVPYLQPGEATSTGYGSVRAIAAMIKIPERKVEIILNEFLWANIGHAPETNWPVMTSDVVKKDFDGAVLVNREFVSSLVECWNANHETDQIEYIGPKLTPTPMPVIASAQPEPAALAITLPLLPWNGAEKAEDKGEVAEPKRLILIAQPPEKRNRTPGPKQRETEFDGNLLPKRQEILPQSLSRGRMCDKHNMAFPDSNRALTIFLSVFPAEKMAEYAYRKVDVVYFTPKGAELAVFVHNCFESRRAAHRLKAKFLDEAVHNKGIEEATLDALIEKIPTRVARIIKDRAVGGRER